ncbi:MAG: hypothetical protein RML45_08730 [Acetobacteraceae bacterium]|nr:hypothetical protein [Acetobacteraceae bacterium]
MPEVLGRLPRTLRARTKDAIDFASLAGKVVAVFGAGASGFDNAATALEAGAREGHRFRRRAEPMVIQPYQLLAFVASRVAGQERPDDRRRWFMSHILGLRENFPTGTCRGVIRLPRFALHAGWCRLAVRIEGQELGLGPSRGPLRAEVAIEGTAVPQHPRTISALDRGADPTCSGATATHRRRREVTTVLGVSQPIARLRVRRTEARDDALDRGHAPVRDRHDNRPSARQSPRSMR